jgi:hypothetical protein
MIRTILEYVACYSSAFGLGFLAGFALAIATRHKPSKTSMWRRRHVSK